MKNNKIFFDVSLLKEEFKSNYWKIVGELSKNEINKKLQEILYVGLGGIVSLSQIAEYSFKSICDLFELIDKNISDEELENAFNYVLENIDNQDSMIENPLTLGKVFNKLLNLGIISTEFYEKYDFLVENRNIFIHHYFVVNPKTLKEPGNLKSIIKEIYFTLNMFHQIIKDVFASFKEISLERNKNLLILLDKIGNLFVGDM